MDWIPSVVTITIRIHSIDLDRRRELAYIYGGTLVERKTICFGHGVRLTYTISLCWPCSHGWWLVSRQRFKHLASWVHIDLPHGRGDWLLSSNWQATFASRLRRLEHLFNWVYILDRSFVDLWMADSDVNHHLTGLWQYFGQKKRCIIENGRTVALRETV